MFPILISIPRLRLGDYWVNEWVKCSKVLLFNRCTDLFPVWRTKVRNDLIAIHVYILLHSPSTS